MAPRQPLNDEQRRLLRITARMPLASVANLASVIGNLSEDRVRTMLGRLRGGGWVSSVMRGMTERRQHRWFLTSKAVDLLYTTDHQHPGAQGRGPGHLASPQFHPERELPGRLPGAFRPGPRPPGRTWRTRGQLPLFHR